MMFPIWKKKTFNRTILECKSIIDGQQYKLRVPFNRTILECKLKPPMLAGIIVSTFNRTILECKFIT